MKRIIAKQIPEYIKKEVEVLNKHVLPLMKKSTTYSFISIPMILFAVTNLFFLYIYQGFSGNNFYYVLLLAIIAATGLALLKESKSIQKEVLHRSKEFFIERIKKSIFVPDSKKKQFIQMINSQPILGLNTFVQFLEEEKKMENNL